MRRLTWGLAIVVLLASALLVFGSGGSSPGEEANASLRAADRRPYAEDSSVVVRRLYEGPSPDTWGTDPSPDGRYLTQTEWATGDLAVRDLLTGELRSVTDKGSWDDSDAYSEMAVFSPDGSEIAYLWMNEDAQYEIRIIGADGSNPRIVLPATPELFDWPGLYDWSPDGEHLLLLLHRDEGSELASLSLEDGSVTVLLEMAAFQGANVAWFSPDGRYIAFDQHSEPFSGKNPDPDKDVYLIPAGGGEKVALLRGPARDLVLGWEPDGRAILFHSDRGLTEGVWRLPVVDGRVAGEPELLKGDLWGLEPIGVSQGSLYYGITTERTALYTVGLDLEGGRLVTPASAVEADPQRLSGAFAWSPDGRQLAYIRGGLPGPNVNERQLVIRSLPGDRPRTMSLPILNVMKLWWLPDGRGLILASPAPTWEDDRAWRGLFRFDLEAGDHAPIEGSEGVPWFAALSRDLTVAYYTPWLGDPNHFLVRDLQSGMDRELVRLDTIWEDARAGGRPALSPDDRWLAVSVTHLGEPRARALAIISTESGTVRELYRRDFPTGISRSCGDLLWHPDGSHVIFGLPDPASDGCTHFRISIEGGEPTPILQLPAQRRSGLSPDGTRLAYQHGEWRGEIWVMQYGRGEGR